VLIDGAKVPHCHRRALGRVDYRRANPAAEVNIRVEEGLASDGAELENGRPLRVVLVKGLVPLMRARYQMEVSLAGALMSHLERSVEPSSFWLGLTTKFIG